MSTDLRSQLVTYGDVFLVDLGTVTVEDVMTSHTDDDNVATLEPVERHQPPNRPRRGTLIAAAVFALVLAVGAIVGIAWLGGGDDVVPADTTVPSIPDSLGPPFDTPEEAAAVWLTTYGTGTADELASFLAADFRGYGMDGPSVAEIDEQQRYDLALGITMELGECTANSATSTTCVVFVESEVDGLLFGDPEFENNFTVRIDEDGLISGFNMTLASGQDPQYDLREEWGAWNAERLPPAIERIPGVDRESQLSISPEEAARIELDALRQFVAERS